MGAQLPPAGHLLSSDFGARPYELRPVLLVVPHKVALAAPAAFLDELVGLEEPIFDRLRVELHLVARDGVDERPDHLEERLEQEGDVQDQRGAQALGVVRLENIQDLTIQSRSKHAPPRAVLAKQQSKRVPTSFDVENDAFFPLSAKLINNTIDLSFVELG